MAFSLETAKLEGVEDVDQDSVRAQPNTLK